MAILGRFQKQPNEVLDYDVDFTDWLEGAVIDSATVIAEPGIDVIAHYVQGSIVKTVLSGGASGSRYKITVRATTDSQLLKEADFIVSVKEW